MAAILPASCLDLMRKGNGLTNTINTSPYQWRSFQRGPESIRSTWRKALWHLNAFLALCQAIFSAVQCWSSYHNEDGKKSYKIYMVFSTLFYTFGVCLQLENFGNQRALP